MPRNFGVVRLNDLFNTKQDLKEKIMSMFKRRTATYVVTVCELESDTPDDIDLTHSTPLEQDEAGDSWPLPPHLMFPPDKQR